MKKILLIQVLLSFSFVAINAQAVTKTNIVGKWHFAKMTMGNQLTIDVENGKFTKGEEFRELIAKKPEMEKILTPAIISMIKELRISYIEFKNNGLVQAVSKGKMQTAKYTFDEKNQTISFATGGVGKFENANISFIGADRLQIIQNVSAQGKTLTSTIVLKK